MMNGAVILAAGKGVRMGNMDKVFIKLGQYPIVAYSLLAFEKCPDIDCIALVTRQELIGKVQELVSSLSITKPVFVTVGGARRQDSVMNGLNALPAEIDIAVIHDAARPLVTSELIALCIKSAINTGSGVAAKKLVDTIKECDADGFAAKTLDRDRLFAVETPQAFKADILRDALKRVYDAGVSVTDDAGAIEFIGEKIHLVEWHKPNVKLTYAEDQRMILALLTD